MAKKSLKSYIADITKGVEARTGTSVKDDIYLQSNIEAAAKFRLLLDVFYDKLINTDIVIIETGSMDQHKTVLHPAWAQYDKMNRTWLLYAESLGLSFNTTPSKVKEETRKTAEDNDPMAAYYKKTR